MKNYWIGKSAERKIKSYQEEQASRSHSGRRKRTGAARLLREIMMRLIPKVEPTKVSWDTPVLKEIPQENKVYEKQVYVCPLTGIKHNFKVQEQ